MKICPKCKAELDDNARFCLSCMTSLTKKEKLQPPTRKKRWWPLVLACCAVLLVVVIALMIALGSSDEQGETTTTTLAPTTTTTSTPTDATTEPATSGDEGTITQTEGGITYTLRPTTSDEHPMAIRLDNHYTIIRVEGTPDNGRYTLPSFVGDDKSALVTVVADGAFDGVNARAVDIGYNVRYIWDDALAGADLEALYLHNDVFIDSAVLDNCAQSLVIHCPSYIENTQGLLWSDIAADYGFGWVEELI